MKFKIKYINSSENKCIRLARVACVLLFLLCLALNSFYHGAELPEFFYKCHCNYQRTSAEFGGPLVLLLNFNCCWI